MVKNVIKWLKFPACVGFICQSCSERCWYVQLLWARLALVDWYAVLLGTIPSSRYCECVTCQEGLTHLLQSKAGQCRYLIRVINSRFPSLIPKQRRGEDSLIKPDSNVKKMGRFYTWNVRKRAATSVHTVLCCAPVVLLAQVNTEEHQ